MQVTDAHALTLAHNGPKLCGWLGSDIQDKIFDEALADDQPSR
jgi:hypothetical protein